MKLTIIIPAYNAEKTIEKCIKSIITSSSDDFEVIIIDDGSVDSTKEIVEKYIEKDNRILLISVENKGVSNARNIGLCYARGKYITFIDSDDYFFDYSVDLMLKKIDHDVDLHVFSYVLNKQGSKRNILFENKIMDQKECVKKHVIDSIDLNTCWGKIYKKELIQKNNIIFPLEQKIGEDSIFVLKYLNISNKIAFHSDMLLLYNFISGNTMTNYKIEWFDDYIRELYVREKVALKSNNNPMRIYYNYIKMYFLFFISYSSNHSLYNIKRALESPRVVNYRLILTDKIKPIKLSQKLKYVFFVNSNYIIALVFKILNIVKVLKNKF